MSSVNTQVRDVIGSDVREVLERHKWLAIGIGTTAFWLVWGFTLDLIGWDLAGGVTGAFAFVWLFNVVFVWVFMYVIRVTTTFAEQ